jgi:zinc transporter, ZIP family
VGNPAAALGWGVLVGTSLVAGAVAAAVLTLPDREAGVGLTIAGVLAGALVYVAADAWLSRDEEMDRMRRSGHAAAAGRPMPMHSADAARGESIAAGLFVDGVPESLALGLTVAEDELGVALLAGILIGNVVEAYGAAQPIVAGGRTKRFAITLLAAIGAALALATLIGGTVLADASGELVGTAQAVAAGAVLAVVTIAIVPHAFEEVSRLVAATTVLGFLLGYVLS